MLQLARNRLAWPAGVKPGFDPSHVAGGQCLFSGVSVPAGFLNVLNGIVGVNTSTPTAAIKGLVGPSTTYDNAVSSSIKTTFTTGNTATLTRFTIATVVEFFALASFNALFAGNTSTAGTIGQFASSNTLMMRISNTNVSSAIPLANGVPYLLITSCDVSIATNNVNYLALNLATGKYTTEVNTMGTSSVALDNYIVGNWGGTLPAGAVVSAAMFSNNFLSLPQMMQWATDPWSFWYPANDNDEYGATAAAGSHAPYYYQMIARAA